MIEKKNNKIDIVNGNQKCISSNEKSFFLIYVFIYMLLCLLPFGCSLHTEIKTGAYPDLGECVIGTETQYYYNALSFGEEPCLLVFEGIWEIQWYFLIISLFLFFPLLNFRKKVWNDERLGALPEWIIITLIYWFCLMFLSPKVYSGLYGRLITLSAVLEIFYPFLIWQTMVTVGYWIYKKNKKFIKSKTW